MGEYQHNNPWAEKLLQVSLPDSGEAWQAMESRLDEQYPRWWSRDWRRWVLLILLLLLLIGVCNCPGGRRLFHGSATVSRKPAPTASASDRIIPGPTPPARRPAPTNATGELPRVTGPAEYSTAVPAGPSAPNPTKPSAPARPSAPAGSSASAGRSAPAPAPAPQPIPSTPRSAEPEGPTEYPKIVGVKSLHPGHKRRRRQENIADTLVAGKSVATARPPAHNSPATKGNPAAPGTVTSSGTTTPPAASGPPGTHTGNPVRTPPLAKDSAGKKGKPVPAKAPVPPKQEKQKEKENGLMAAIGLNQFFPLGGQQSVYNSDGTSGTLSDYIPVPVLRYYFNRKFYVQLEAQINTPQATKKNLVISSPPLDTSTIPGQTIQSSASIQQLFYFNVPLSIHYTLFDNFDVGAGLQFSRLTNAIGSFDTATTVANGPNITPVNSNAVRSFKGDALYQKIKTDEFRFLLDMSYTYKHFIGGLRYNQALSKFVDIQIAPGETTQGRNSSLQLYLRYILWDGRKKRVSPEK